MQPSPPVASLALPTEDKASQLAVLTAINPQERRILQNRVWQKQSAWNLQTTSPESKRLMCLASSQQIDAVVI
jgi:hypothetical protein